MAIPLFSERGAVSILADDAMVTPLAPCPALLLEWSTALRRSAKRKHVGEDLASASEPAQPSTDAVERWDGIRRTTRASVELPSQIVPHTRHIPGHEPLKRLKCTTVCGGSGNDLAHRRFVTLMQSVVLVAPRGAAGGSVSRLLREQTWNGSGWPVSKSEDWLPKVVSFEAMTLELQLGEHIPSITAVF